MPYYSIFRCFSATSYLLSATRENHRQAIFLAEGVGFEPTELSLNGFQDRRLKPLGHPSLNLCEPITKIKNPGQHYFVLGQGQYPYIFNYILLTPGIFIGY